MIKVFDRKMDFAALSVFPGFIYLLLPLFFDNWVAPPPGVEFVRWISILAEILGNYLDIRIAARGLLVDQVLAVWHEWQARGITIYPTLVDVLERIARLRYALISHLQRYQETLVNRLQGLVTDLGQQICSHRQLDWQRFLNEDWAISLVGLPTDRQNLFITVTIAKILTYRMVNNLRSQQLVDLYVFDEASTMFKSWYEHQEGTYLLLDYLAKAREFGAGFIIATQTMSNLADSVLANTAIKVLVGGAGIGSDCDTFASATGMTVEQREFLKQLTLPGQACGKDPRYPYPFTLEVPRIA